MDLFLSLILSPAAFAAFVAALYWVYPIALLQGYKKFGGYLYAGLSRKFLQVGDMNYSYYERAASVNSTGAGSTERPITLLFLHGFSANKTMWMVMSKYLPKEWRLIMLDLPGHGESSFKPNADYSPYGIADKLHEFVEALDLEDIHLVGVSMGSLISAAYANRYQHKVKTISIMCIPVTHKLPNGVKTHFFESLENGKILILPRNAQEFQDMMELVLFNPSAYTFHHRMREALVKMQEPNYTYLEEIMQDLVNDKYGQDPDMIKEFAQSINVPTLVLWGAQDKICHPSGAAMAGELIKASKVVVLDKCGHAMTMDRPRKCAKLVQDFIRSESLKCS